MDYASIMNSAIFIKCAVIFHFPAVLCIRLHEDKFNMKPLLIYNWHPFVILIKRTKDKWMISER